jgi:thiamine pyrophosphate-dependent acetolactate synthase large subunit-like protein
MFVLDNHCYENTGAQATATAYRTQLDQVAKGAGIEKVYRWRNESDVDSSFSGVLKEEGPVVVVVDIEKGRETKGEIKIGMIENKIRFMKAVGSC